MVCDCEEYKTWHKIEMGRVGFLFAHRVEYPRDGPTFKFCPFCGKELRVKDE